MYVKTTDDTGKMGNIEKFVLVDYQDEKSIELIEVCVLEDGTFTAYRTSSSRELTEVEEASGEEMVRCLKYGNKLL